MSEESSIIFSELGQRSHPPTVIRLMAMALENPELLSIAAGFTDTASLPVEGVRTAVAELAENQSTPEYLQYGSNRGRPGLRKILVDHLCELEPELDHDETQRGLFVTNGSQQALYLAMQVLCNPGDIVLVDRPSYFVFLEMLEGLGIEARSIPVDEDGLVDGEAFAGLLEGMKANGEAERIKAVYFVSYFSNPSGRSLTREEKALIGSTLRNNDLIIPVIEDAAYRDLYFRDPWPSPSILTIPEWDGFPRMYTSTLTKPYATGLKVGFATCSDLAWSAKMLHVKAHHDFGTANFNQAVFERVLSNGGFNTQLRRIRKTYESKMIALDSALRDEGLEGMGWSWAKPTGGLYLWLTAPAGLNTGLDSGFCERCVQEGVLYVPGELCFGDDAAVNCIRLSFGVLAESELAEAGCRFAKVAREFAQEDKRELA